MVSQGGSLVISSWKSSPSTLNIQASIGVLKFAHKGFNFDTAVIRYLNNPEAMGGAAWFGLALVSGSKLVLSLAVVRHLANWWFLSYVEKYDSLSSFILYLLMLT